MYEAENRNADRTPGPSVVVVVRDNVVCICLYISSINSEKTGAGAEVLELLVNRCKEPDVTKRPLRARDLYATVHKVVTSLPIYKDVPSESVYPKSVWRNG